MQHKTVLRKTYIGKYQKISDIGKGSYGDVFKAYDSTTDRYVAIKCFLNENGNEHRGSIGALRELDLMHSIDHPYVNKVLDVVYCDNARSDDEQVRTGWTDDKIYLVSELANYTLYDYIMKMKSVVTYPMIKRMMTQLLQAIAGLHRKRISHRDIKPRNILCYEYVDSATGNKYIDAKLTDFGLSKPMNSLNVNSLQIVTLRYRAPELILGNHAYTDKIDIWGLGCVFYEMLMHTYMFNGKSDLEILSSIFRTLGTPHRNVLRAVASGDISDSVMNVVQAYRSPHQNIPSLLNLHRLQIDEFNKTDNNGYKTSGTFDQFCDLFEQMMQIDPNKRPSAIECLEHPFFADLPESNNASGWFGLCRQYLPPRHYHTLHRNNFYLAERNNSLHYIRSIGMDAIKYKRDREETLINSFSYNNKQVDNDIDGDIAIQGDRIMFLALDIYDRCIMKFGNNKASYDFDKIAIVCGYIAIKYFLGDNAPGFKQIFSGCKYQSKQIEETERDILQHYLYYRIYRPTVYDLLDHNVCIAGFFDLISLEEANYNGDYDVYELAQHYNSQVVEQLNKFIKTKSKKKTGDSTCIPKDITSNARNIRRTSIQDDKHVIHKIQNNSKRDVKQYKKNYVSTAG